MAEIGATDRHFQLPAYIAAIMGLVLLSLGFVIPILWLQSAIFFGRPYFTLVACVGLALVLAAFGTRGEVKYRGIYVTGAGAIAIILYFLLNPQKISEFRSQWRAGAASPNASTSAIQGYLYGAFDNDLRAIVMSAHNMFIYGAFDFNGSKIERYEFEVKDGHFRSTYGDCIVVNIYEKSSNKRFYVPASYVGALDDSSDMNSRVNWKDQSSISWWYDGKSILSNKGVLLGAQSCNFAAPIDKPLSSAASPVTLASFFRLNAAHAEETSAPSKSGSETISNDALLLTIIENLHADSPLVQAAAQKAILDSKERIAPSLMKWFTQSGRSERDKVDMLTILSLISNSSQDSFEKLVKPVLTSNGPVFTDLVTDDSKTVRTIATSLLYAAADVSAVGDLVAAYKKADSGEKRTNVALVLSGIFDRVDSKRRTSLAETIKPIALEPGASELLRGIVEASEKNRNQNNKTGWIFFGVLDDPNLNKWSQKYFEKGGSSKIPEVGDIVQSEARINLRENVIELTDKGWVNKPAIGVVMPKEKYYVTDVKEVVDGYWWARVRQSPQ
jgi:hypothetical protein